MDPAADQDDRIREFLVQDAEARKQLPFTTDNPLKLPHTLPEPHRSAMERDPFKYHQFVGASTAAYIGEGSDALIRAKHHIETHVIDHLTAITGMNFGFELFPEKLPTAATGLATPAMTTKANSDSVDVHGWLGRSPSTYDCGSSAQFRFCINPEGQSSYYSHYTY